MKNGESLSWRNSCSLILALAMVISSSSGCSKISLEDSNETEPEVITSQGETAIDPEIQTDFIEESQNSESEQIQNDVDVIADTTGDSEAVYDENVEEQENGTDAIPEEESVIDTFDLDMEEEPEGNELTPTQRNSINMLNYMTVLAQKVNESKGNRLFLESAYSSLENDIYPNSVDRETQARILGLMDTINQYRMIEVKRKRLEFIYEQNRAQAMRQAIPNPVALLSVVQSGSVLKAALSVLYMAADSVSSYQSAASQADLQFIKDGWELDDAESAELHNSTKDALSYMLNMVRAYDLPGDYALNQESVENFVFWSSKPYSQIVSKIAWLEKEYDTYKAFGPYWLELAKDYYDSKDYEKCLEAIAQYESVSTRIFRKDIDYANALPMAVISAKETMSGSDYVVAASNYCDLIVQNTKDPDWSLRYFAAQIYLDLYNITGEDSYLEDAYKIVFDNVNNILVDNQRELNRTYLEEIQEVKTEKDATKREKEEAKQYNKLIKEERKTALPPVDEALYLNCDLLFLLAEKKNVPTSERKRIESILHENGEEIFLTKALDNQFWFGTRNSKLNSKRVPVEFDGNSLQIPAVFISDKSTVTVIVSGKDGTRVINDWEVTEVRRPKNSGIEDFLVILQSKDGKAYKYQAGEEIVIRIVPVEETPDKYYDVEFVVKAVKKAFVFNGIEFERVMK